MSSPERRRQTERNIARLAELVKRLGEAELFDQQWMLRSDQRLLQSERRAQELAEQMRRIRESNAENLRSILSVITQMQADLARIDAAS